MIQWGNVADWAQVFSTMLGLLIAYRLGAHQSAVIQYEAKRDLAIAMHTLTNHVNLCMESCCKTLIDKNTYVAICNKQQYFDRHSFDLLLRNLNQLQLDKLPTTNIITGVVLIQANLLEFIHNIDIILTSDPKQTIPKHQYLTDLLVKCSQLTALHVFNLEEEVKRIKKPHLLKVL